ASAVNAHFRPEFINRIDRVVPFQRLTHPEIERVLRLLLAKSALRRGFVERGIELVLSDDAQRWLAEQGYSAVYGARALRRELEDRVLAPVAELLSRLGGEAAGSRVVVRLSAER